MQGENRGGDAGKRGGKGKRRRAGSPNAKTAGGTRRRSAFLGLGWRRGCPLRLGWSPALRCAAADGGPTEARAR